METKYRATFRTRVFEKPLKYFSQEGEVIALQIGDYTLRTIGGTAEKQGARIYCDRMPEDIQLSESALNYLFSKEGKAQLLRFRRNRASFEELVDFLNDVQSAQDFTDVTEQMQDLAEYNQESNYPSVDRTQFYLKERDKPRK